MGMTNRWGNPYLNEITSTHYIAYIPQDFPITQKSGGDADLFPRILMLSSISYETRFGKGTNALAA